MKCAESLLMRSWVLQSGRLYCLMSSALGSSVMQDSWKGVLKSGRYAATGVRSTAWITTSARDLDWVLQSGQRHQSLCSYAVISGFSGSMSGLRFDALYILRHVLSCLYDFSIFTLTGNIGEREVKEHARTSWNFAMKTSKRVPRPAVTYRVWVVSLV